jgi:hypothetical protein
MCFDLMKITRIILFYILKKISKIINNQIDEEFFLIDLYILKYLHNSFIIHDIKKYFSIKTIRKESRYRG